MIAAIAPAVTSAIYAHAGEELRREIGGVLVGVHQLTSSGYVVRVTGTIRAQHTDAAHTHVTFTHETWDQVHAELERDHQGRAIVGWYHSHPGLGLFLSSMDRFICDNFFNLPWHIAMVVDPVAGDDVYFGWRGKELARMSPTEESGLHQEDGFLILELIGGETCPDEPGGGAPPSVLPESPAPSPPDAASLPADQHSATPSRRWLKQLRRR